jgi:hypothetical protein
MHLIKFLKIENNIMAPNVCTRRTMIGRIGPTPDPIACRHFLHLTLAIKLPPPSSQHTTCPLYSSLSQQPAPTPLLLPLAAADAAPLSFPPATPPSLLPPQWRLLHSPSAPLLPLPFPLRLPLTGSREHQRGAGGNSDGG